MMRVLQKMDVPLLSSYGYRKGALGVFAPYAWIGLVALILLGGPATGAEVRWVFPSETDPQIEQMDEPHLVVAAETVARNKLFVFFPGTGGLPVDYQEITSHAASLGYDAIALTYMNEESINIDVCGGAGNGDCFERARREIKEGRDLHPGIVVTRLNSIENRLLRLLEWLAAHYPEERWDSYFEGEALRWTEIAVAGHSQGGGHAGFISRCHVVERCIVFSGADWFGQGQRVADWLQWPSATPSKRIYGFAHERDLSPSIAISRQAWNAYGLDVFGPELRGDGLVEFGDSHRLTSNLEPAPGSGIAGYHNCTAVDWAVPRDGAGRPQYEAIWTHLLTHLQAGPGERMAKLNKEGEGIIDPEFSCEGGWATWQDELRRLWIGRIDLDNGLLIRDETLVGPLDFSLAPIPDSRQGPEILLYEGGVQVVYTKEEGALFSIWRTIYDTETGLWLPPQRLSPNDGRSRGGVLTVGTREWNRPAIIYWLDSGYEGDLCWTWLDESEWQDRILGPVGTLSTPARFSPDGRHLLFTLPDGEDSDLYLLDSGTGQVEPVTTGGNPIVNPFALMRPGGGPGEMLVGGIVNKTTFRVFSFVPGEPVVWLEDLAAPAVAQMEDYDQLASPEVFEFRGRAFVLTEVAKGSAGGAPDAQMWILELDPRGTGERIVLRVDDGTPGARRLDPELLRGIDDVFVYYHQLRPDMAFDHHRIRSGLEVFAHAEPLHVAPEDGAWTLTWSGRAEPVLQTTTDFSSWSSEVGVESPAHYGMVEDGVVGFRLRAP